MTVASAGLAALEGVPADATAQRLMAGLGLDISDHRGRQLTSAMALRTDLILVMDERQKMECGQMVPSATGRIFLLGHWQPDAAREIPDPFRKGPGAFQAALDQISRSIEDWLPRLKSSQRLP